MLVVSMCEGDATGPLVNIPDWATLPNGQPGPVPIFVYAPTTRVDPSISIVESSVSLFVAATKNIRQDASGRDEVITEQA